MFQTKTGDTQFCLTNSHKTVKQISEGRTLHWNWFLLLLLGLASCKSFQEIPNRHQRHLNRFLKESPAISASNFGFYLVAPSKSKPLFSFSEKKHFIPASTTKILTLVEGLSVLGDTLPGLEYRFSGDTLFFRGTGDPCLLHPEMEAFQGVYNWLQQLPPNVHLMYCPHPEAPSRFGRGWAWDDYAFGFQPEQSALPIYGNTVLLAKGTIQPSYFSNRLFPGQLEVRLEDQNRWSDREIKPESTRKIPFRTNELAALLADTLNRAVGEAPPDSLQHTWASVPGCPTDTLYRRMMLDSDNLIAEQLYWNIQQEPLLPKDRWKNIRRVDGSGLSRYNLVSPNVLATALESLYEQQPIDWIQQLFPAGGQTGTLKEWFGNGEKPPYVYAKTGSMSGVYCLAGYLTTNKGKTLIFSFMCNNFIGSNRVIKEELQVILEYIRDKM